MRRMQVLAMRVWMLLGFINFSSVVDMGNLPLLIVGKQQQSQKSRA
jgi:hypothetical protein